MLTNLFIFGLGNPGLEYRFSRHNFGFIAVDNFAKQNNFPEFANKKNYAASSLFLTKAAKNVHLIKPMTYMNQSGIAVKEVLKKHGVFNIKDMQDSDVIVIHDDLDLNFGRIKIKAGGSGGSHNGLISIINSIQSKNFIRLKLGINSDLRNKFKTGADFVLANFAKDEVKQMPEILKALNDILIAIINEGIVKTMNEFNSLLKN